jgi:hypothetical protein
MCSEKLLLLNYDYHAKTNFVPVTRIGEYLQSLEKMENQLAYGLNWEDEAVTGKTNMPIILACFCYSLLLLAGFGWAYYLAYRHAQPSPMPPQIVRPDLVGIGGWLIFVAVILGASLLQRVMVLNTLWGIFSSARWHTLTSPHGMNYQPAYAGTLTWELFGGVTMTFITLMTGILFIQKRRNFPRWFIILLLSNLIFVVVDQWLGASLHLPVTLGKTNAVSTGPIPIVVMQVLGGCLIWIPYMLKSERVKGTFVRGDGLGQKEAP